MKIFAQILLLALLTSCGTAQNNKGESVQQTEENQEFKWEETSTLLSPNGTKIPKAIRTPEEWSSELTENEFYILREKGTERAFTSELLNVKEDGVFTCAGCQMPLFETKTKFKSGTGWPSFYEPIAESFILEDVDFKIGYARTEVMCNRCQGHLGHVFNDGPQPTGLRYCINGIALHFKKEAVVDDLLKEITRTEN